MILTFTLLLQFYSLDGFKIKALIFFIFAGDRFVVEWRELFLQDQNHSKFLDFFYYVFICMMFTALDF